MITFLLLVGVGLSIYLIRKSNEEKWLKHLKQEYEGYASVTYNHYDGCNCTNCKARDSFLEQFVEGGGTI